MNPTPTVIDEKEPFSANAILILTFGKTDESKRYRQSESDCGLPLICAKFGFLWAYFTMFLFKEGSARGVLSLILYAIFTAITS